MRPGSELHGRTLQYLKRRIDASEDKMRLFYDRWRVNEEKAQAYINLPDYEKVLKQLNEASGPTAAISITVPYAFATMSSVVAFLSHMFLSRRPVFQVGAYRKDVVEAAKAMELALQYNGDHARLQRKFWQWLLDGQLYGLAVFMTGWEDRKALRTSWKQLDATEVLPGQNTSEPQRVREERTVYSGNTLENIDPYLFFPDPNVPMCEVNRRGEFVFWRRFVGKHVMLQREAAGEFKWINYAGSSPAGRSFSGDSRRNAISGGDSIAGWDYGGGSSRTVRNVMQLDQGTAEIIPAEMGLGESEQPEKWMFTMANRRQIVQAEPFEADHEMHPVCVSEPYTMGYGFGQPGQIDYLTPVQDALGFFINSHIDNVKGWLNNTLILDPSAVEMTDVKNPGPGKRIRLKASAYGRDVRSAVQQLVLGDVTQNHVRDMEIFYRMGDMLTGTNENVRGQQEQGGRKTATEIRRATENAGSRLVAQAILISSQGVVDLTEQWSLNIQQYMDTDFYMHLAGDLVLTNYLGQLSADGMLAGGVQGLPQSPEGISITPEMLVGDFHFPVHDGVLPLDRVALLDIWSEIFTAVSTNEFLLQQFDIVKIFEHMAELGGAKNISQFRIQVQPGSPEQIARGVQGGTLAPIQGGAPSLVPSGGAGGAVNVGVG